MPAPGPTARPSSPRGAVPGLIPSATASRRMRMALGTWVAIEAEGPAAAIERAFQAIAAVEERLHPPPGGSDLQRLRDSPTGERVGIHPMTFRVLSFARRLFALSGGVFDPCLPGRPG